MWKETGFVKRYKDPQGTLKKYLDFTYDAYNNLKKIINPDTTYTEYTYDGRKNPTAQKDPKNNSTLYTYDPLSRLKDVNQPLATTTHFGYDTQDNQATVTDPKGNVTSYYNDDFGRKNQTGSPDYAAIALLLIGTVMLMPRFAALALSWLPRPRAPAPRLAIAQLAGTPGRCP